MIRPHRRMTIATGEFWRGRVSVLRRRRFGPKIPVWMVATSSRDVRSREGFRTHRIGNRSRWFVAVANPAATIVFLAEAACFVPNGSPPAGAFGLFRKCARAPLLPASGRPVLARPMKGPLDLCCDYQTNNTFPRIRHTVAGVGVPVIGDETFLVAAIVVARILGIADRPAAVEGAEAFVVVVAAAAAM